MHGRLSFKPMHTAKPTHTAQWTRPVTPADPAPGGLVSEFTAG
jgi:hypothetical protein